MVKTPAAKHLSDAQLNIVSASVSRRTLLLTPAESLTLPASSSSSSLVEKTPSRRGRSRGANRNTLAPISNDNDNDSITSEVNDEDTGSSSIAPTPLRRSARLQQTKSILTDDRYRTTVGPGSVRDGVDDDSSIHYYFHPYLPVFLQDWVPLMDKYTGGRSNGLLVLFIIIVLFFGPGIIQIGSGRSTSTAGLTVPSWGRSIVSTQMKDNRMDNVPVTAIINEKNDKHILSSTPSSNEKGTESYIREELEYVFHSSPSTNCTARSGDASGTTFNYTAPVPMVMNVPITQDTWEDDPFLPHRTSNDALSFSSDAKLHNSVPQPTQPEQPQTDFTTAIDTIVVSNDTDHTTIESEPTIATESMERNDTVPVTVKTIPKQEISVLSTPVSTVPVPELPSSLPSTVPSSTVPSPATQVPEGFVYLPETVEEEIPHDLPLQRNIVTTTVSGDIQAVLIQTTNSHHPYDITYSLAIDIGNTRLHPLVSQLCANLVAEIPSSHPLSRSSSPSVSSTVSVPVITNDCLSKPSTQLWAATLKTHGIDNIPSPFVFDNLRKGDTYTVTATVLNMRGKLLHVSFRTTVPQDSTARATTTTPSTDMDTVTENGNGTPAIRAGW